MKIYLGTTLAATVTPGMHYYRLEYAREYLEKPEAIPLSNSLPLSEKPLENQKVKRWFENLITEHSAMLEFLQKQYHISDISSPISILEKIGQDTPGAFTFAPDNQEPDWYGAARRVSEAEIGDALRRLATMNMPYTPRISLAGAQPKTSYALGDNGVWYETTGATPSTHIFKPPTPGNENIQHVEHVIQNASTKLGIPSAKTSVATFDGQSCLLVERFDREKTKSGETIRLHQEDLLQALGRARSPKYQLESGPGIKELIQTIRKLYPQDEPTVWRLLAFNVATGNSDAHAKNFSFLITPSGSKLAPAYDLNSLVPYPQYTQDLAMSIGRTYDYRHVTEQDWQQAAQKTDTDPNLVLEQVAYVNDNVVPALSEAINETGLDVPELNETFEYVRKKFPPPHAYPSEVLDGLDTPQARGGSVFVRQHRRADGTQVRANWRKR